MLKLALLQCNVKDGDIAGNVAKILEFAHKAPLADLCIAPLEAITGPNYSCLIRQPDFESAALSAIRQIPPGLPAGQTVLCGIPPNSYFLITRSEARKIEPNFELGGKRIAIDIEPDAGAPLDIYINMTSRPFTVQSQNEWELILSGVAFQNRVFAISVNLAGGYGQHIYSGQSVAMTPEASILARAVAFAEDCPQFELRENTGQAAPLIEDRQENIWLALTTGLRDFIHKHGAHKAIIGLSGGMDSALVACIAAKALGSENVTGIFLPSRYTSEASRRDALELAANLGIATRDIPIEPVVEACNDGLMPALASLNPLPDNLMAENLQARIRGMLLMALANASGAFVLNTGNKSEAAMGYSTLYGDTVGAVAVIGDLFKTEVYALASWHCEKLGRAVIPRNVFERPPSAELALDQKDTDNLPPYNELDPDLQKIMTFSPDLALPESAALRNIRARVFANGFKRRQGPPALLVTSLQPCQD